MVPFVDLKAQYKSIKPEIDAAIGRVIESASFILGPEVENFEHALAQNVGARFALESIAAHPLCSSPCRASGVGAGDEAILPSNLCVAGLSSSRFSRNRETVSARAVAADVCRID